MSRFYVVFKNLIIGVSISYYEGLCCHHMKVPWEIPDLIVE